jgi:hypothetical protein
LAERTPMMGGLQSGSSGDEGLGLGPTPSTPKRLKRNGMETHYLNKTRGSISKKLSEIQGLGGNIRPIMGQEMECSQPKLSKRSTL